MGIFREIQASFALEVAYRETRPPFWDALISRYRRPMTNGAIAVVCFFNEGQFMSGITEEPIFILPVALARVPSYNLPQSTSKYDLCALFKGGKVIGKWHVCLSSLNRPLDAHSVHCLWPCRASSIIYGIWCHTIRQTDLSRLFTNAYFGHQMYIVFSYIYMHCISIRL